MKHFNLSRPLQPKTTYGYYTPLLVFGKGGKKKALKPSIKESLVPPKANKVEAVKIEPADVKKVNKATLSTEYSAIAQSTYRLRMLEESNRLINSPKTYSIFSLLKKFYLSDEEKKKYLKDQNFFGHLHFYLIGQAQMINQKIESKIELEKTSKNILLDKIAPLDPPAKLQEKIIDVFLHQKTILKTLQSVNIIAKGVTIAATAFTLLWLSYNAKNFLSDYSQYCNAESNEPDILAGCKAKCPTEDPMGYFYKLNTAFFALPALVVLGIVAQQVDNEILSRFIFSPLDSVRKSASTITEKVSDIKSFLLNKACDPTFKRPSFLKV